MNKKELEHFRKVDPKLYELALKIELFKLPLPQDYFVDIVDSIISQQLSGKAALTIFERFKKLFPKGGITPQKLVAIPDEKIRERGISYSKIRYLKGVAQAVLNKEINLEKLKEKPDEEVINELIKLKGIGRWTAEMFLIFTLLREDVFSSGDLGLKNAIIKHYKLKNPKEKDLLKISSKWSPFRSLASRILWKSLEIKE